MTAGLVGSSPRTRAPTDELNAPEQIPDSHSAERAVAELNVTASAPFKT
jgi:hypothetical protein